MSRSTFKSVVLTFVIIVATVLMLASAERKSTRRAINPPGSNPDAPFSNGLLVGNTLYVAGQEGLVNGKLQPGGVVPETQAALENIKKILELAGMQMSDVVTATVYLADMNDFVAMSNTYKTYFPKPRPARATVQVARLVNDARVEISVIAVKQH